MARAPFQILVLPFYIDTNNAIKYALFRRTEKSGGYWQAVAGGGEDEETSLEAAKREAWEEANISKQSKYYTLDSHTTIPVVNVVDKFLWGNQVYVVTEYSFGVQVDTKDITLSKEHQEYKWVSYEEAKGMLKWDSNKNALWELNERILRGSLK